MKTYRLVSTKGSRVVSGNLSAALAAAIEMEADLQPLFGITIENDRNTVVAEVRDGKRVR